MKKLIVVLFSLLSLQYAFAGTNFDIGSGSGALTLNSMTGHARGDTANIVAGSYSSGDLSNLFGIYIRPKNGGAITFTGTVVMLTDSGVALVGSSSNYIVFNGFTNNAIRNNTATVGHGWVDVELGFLSFTNGSIACIDGEGNMPYTQGNPASYHWLRVVIHDIREHFCPRLIQGSFGHLSDGSGHPPDVMRQVTIYNFIEDSTSAHPPSGQEGSEFAGICFHCTFHDIISTSINVNNPSGDVGLLYLDGWFKAYNIWKYGGPGNVVRSIQAAQEDNDPGRDTIYNVIKANSTGYAVVNLEFDTTASVAGQWHGTGATINGLTYINGTECCGFWGPVVDNGSCPSYEHYNCSNVFGINLQTNGKNHTYVNLGGWNSIGIDTAFSRYFTSCLAAGIDSSTVFITNSSGTFPKYTPLISSGVRNVGGNLGDPFGTDIYGVPRPGGTTWDVGAAQYLASGGIAVANAGPNQSIVQPTNTITLDGSGSTSTTGNITSYVWTQVSGPSIAVITNPNSVTTSVGTFIIGVYVFQLNIVDVNNNTSSDQMTLTVNPTPNVNVITNLNNVRLLTR